MIDGFGDHILGCGDGPLRIRRHDAICGVIWHALVQNNSGCKRGCFYFDVSVHHPLQDSLLCLSAATAGVTAGRGESDKEY